MLVDCFKVPDQPPSLPASMEPSQNFRPSPRFLDYLSFLFWFIDLVIGIGVIVLLVW